KRIFETFLPKLNFNMTKNERPLMGKIYLIFNRPNFNGTLVKRYLYVEDSYAHYTNSNLCFELPARSIRDNYAHYTTNSNPEIKNFGYVSSVVKKEGYYEK